MCHYRALAFKMLKEKLTDTWIMAEDEVRLAPGEDRIRRYWVTIIHFYEELCEFGPTREEAHSIFSRRGMHARHFLETFDMLNRNPDRRDDPQTVLYRKLCDARWFPELESFLAGHPVSQSSVA